MGFKLTFEIDGEKQVSRMLDTTIDELKSLDEPLQDTSKFLLDAFDINFDATGSLLGIPWASRKKDYPWPMLNRTGEMKNSFQDLVDVTSLTIFNPTEYFKYHQRGTSKMPKRVMMRINDQMKQEIVRIFRNYIHKSTGKWR